MTPSHNTERFIGPLAPNTVEVVNMPTAGYIPVTHTILPARITNTRIVIDFGGATGKISFSRETGRCARTSGCYYRKAICRIP